MAQRESTEVYLSKIVLLSQEQTVMIDILRDIVLISFTIVEASKIKQCCNSYIGYHPSSYKNELSDKI